MITDFCSTNFMISTLATCGFNQLVQDALHVLRKAIYWEKNSTIGQFQNVPMSACHQGHAILCFFPSKLCCSIGLLLINHEFSMILFTTIIPIVDETSKKFIRQLWEFTCKSSRITFRIEIFDFDRKFFLIGNLTLILTESLTWNEFRIISLATKFKFISCCWSCCKKDLWCEKCPYEINSVIKRDPLNWVRIKAFDQKKIKGRGTIGYLWN